MGQRRHTGELLEARVECVKRLEQSLAALRLGDRGTRLLHAFEPLQSRDIATRLELHPKVDLRPRIQRHNQSWVDRRGKGLHAPALEMNLARGDDSTRSHCNSRSVVADDAPPEWSKKTDCVVLRAVTLPVRGDDILTPTAYAVRGRAAIRDLRDGRPVGRAVLPDHCLGERWVGSSLSQPCALVIVAEDA